MTLSPVDNYRPGSRKGHCGVEKGSLWSDPHRKDSRNYITPCYSTPASTSARTRDDDHQPHQPPAANNPGRRIPQPAIPSPTIRPMSALRKTGSTREWRQLRIPLLAELTRRGTLQCAAHRSPKCLITITHPQDLVAGHTTPRSAGGTDHQLQPECRPCSDHEGGTLAHQLHHQQPAPPRPW